MRYPILLLLIAFAGPATAQLIGTVPSPVESISQNSVQNMGAHGDTLWIGPVMNYNVGNDGFWRIPEQADSVVNGRGRLFSIALAQDTIFAGLGYSAQIAGEPVQTQQGFYKSVNGGETWSFIDPVLDDPNENVLIIDDDTITFFRYGGQKIPSLPIIVPQQSPPFSVDFKGDVVFFAGWASGIRRSLDFGETWERILLPPTEVDLLHPDNEYDFYFNPRTTSSRDPVQHSDSLSHLNFLGFAVYIDSNDRVWAGTAGGINRSPNALTAPTDSIIWYHSQYNRRSDGLLGNWVINIVENPYDNRIWMTNRIALPGEQQGIVSTEDGETFEQHLVGQLIHNIEFDGEYIYAAGDNGLFLSRNNGRTWEQFRQIRSPNTFIKSGARYYSLAKTNGRLWVGTSDGLASTPDRGETWEITRVDFPLQSGNRYQENAPDVDSYAYPNPFSPNVHELVRLKFEVKESSVVTIRIFDFGMNLIRTVEDSRQVSAGTYEAVWDGLDQHGRKVANGTVFYQIKTDTDEYVGKILVLE